MKIFERLTEFLKTKEPVYLEIRGREAVLAEGYFKIGEYSENAITLLSESDGVRISGVALELKHLSDGRIAIAGRIERLEFI